jgi:predicted helicase
VDKALRKERKLEVIARSQSVSGVAWKRLIPDHQNTWLVPDNAVEFSAFLPLGSKVAKSLKNAIPEAVFKLYSLGVVTNRDEWAYGFASKEVTRKTQCFIKNYNSEAFRLSQEDKTPTNLDDFVNNDPMFLKWTDRLKDALADHLYLKFDDSKVRQAVYRPFSRMHIYFDHLLNQRRYQQHYIFPTVPTEHENTAICVTTLGSEKPFMTLAASSVTDLHIVGAGSGSQCFPFYVYDEDGTNRRENVTDWALDQFRTHYKNKKISKWDVFYYVYGLLHHAGYREKFADNLKRELPRIPLAPDFEAFSAAGQELARLHLDYEQLEPWPLVWLETPGVPLSYLVEKMKLAKDKKSLVVNASLTLAGIPPEAFDYRLGNRSALDWVIDQYQISEDKRSGIRSDPNRPDDPEYIVRLVGQVVRVSIETARIVGGLPAFA